MSKAEKKKVGAVIFKDNRVIATGFNGTVRGTDNKCEHTVESIIGYSCTNCGESCVTNYCDKCDKEFEPITPIYDTKLVTKDSVIHAEENAIIQCASKGIACENSVMFVTHSPCRRCAKTIAQAGISTVYFDKVHDNGDGLLDLVSYNVAVVSITEEGSKWISKFNEEQRMVIEDV